MFLALGVKEHGLVVLTRALSSPHSPLLRLLERQSEILSKAALTASVQVKVEKRPYRPNKKLTSAEIVQVVADYQAGESTRALGKKYGAGRHTIARQLRKAGVRLQGRSKTNYID